MRSYNRSKEGTVRGHRARRLAGLVALVGIVLAAGAAAGPSQARTDATASPQNAKAVKTITLATFTSSAVETAALRRTLSAFQARNRNIRVQHVVLDPYVEGMLARFAARRPPDLFVVDSSVFPDWQRQNLLEPLNARMVAAKFSPRPFYQRLLAGFRDNRGNIYGFPKDWSPLAMQVNTAALQRAGVRAPQTWAQLGNVGRRLRATGQPPICLSVDLARILAFMFQNNGAFLNNAKTRAVVNSSANTAAVATYFGWIQSGIARTPAQLGAGWCGEALGKQQASIIFEGNWVTGFMRTDFPSVRFQSLPMIRNRARGNLGFTVSYSIGRQSRNKAEAFKLLTFLVGPTGMRIWTQNSGFLPSRSDVRAPTGRAIFLREAPWSRPWQFAPGFTRVVDLANSELTAAFEGKQSIDVALRKIQAAATTALRRGR
jgi:multiple sugar transport system substrate-binding protein